MQNKFYKLYALTSVIILSFCVNNTTQALLLGDEISPKSYAEELARRKAYSEWEEKQAADRAWKARCAQAQYLAAQAYKSASSSTQK